MQFDTDAQKSCYEKVAGYMKDLFGEFARTRDDAPAFGIILGSALAQTFVAPWGNDDAIIMTRAWVVQGVEQTPELMRYLLQENYNMLFGAFAVDAVGDIAFNHTLAGSTCDKEELRNSVLMVVRTADKYDDEIVSRWGGQRALDSVSK